jgi:cytochrome c-type biogenesis protein CcmH/NrfF
VTLILWLIPVLLVLLLGLSWSKGGEQPVTEIEMPVSAEQLAG